MTHIGKNLIEAEQQADELRSLLNDAPVLIQVPSGLKDHAIDISDYTSDGGAGARVSVAAGRKSSVRLTFTKEMPRALELNIDLADGATVTVALTCKVSSPALRIIKAEVGVSSRFFLREEMHIESFFYSRCDVALKGAGASFKDEVRYRGGARSEIDMERAAYHTAPDTESFLDTRGVAEEDAKVKWRGKVVVKKQAVKASAFQRHDAIVASPSVQIDSAPILEIHTHDVSCKHSASLRRMKPEHLFYFGSRGFNEKESRKEILDGFLAL